LIKHSKTECKRDTVLYFGPEFEKRLSPNRMFVRGTKQVLVSAGRRWRSRLLSHYTAL